MNEFTAVIVRTKLTLDVFTDLTVFHTFEEGVAERFKNRVQSALADFKPTSCTVAKEERPVDIHQGFKEASKDFLTKAFEGMRPYIDWSKLILLRITGHNMGGVLATYAAYHTMKRMARHFGIDRSQVVIEVVLFEGEQLLRGRLPGQGRRCHRLGSLHYKLLSPQ